MAIWNGGETSGANNTHEHVIAIDLPVKETLLFPTPEKKAVATTASKDGETGSYFSNELPISISSSAPGTSATNPTGIWLNILITVREFFYRIRLQNPKEEDQVIKREVLTEFQAKYAACVSEISCQFPKLKRLHVAMLEGLDVKRIEDMLAAVDDMLGRLHEDPSLIMEQEHQLDGNRLDTELNSVGLWRKGSAIFFTIAAAFSSAAGAAVAKINGIMPAAAGGVAAAASILFIAAGKWMDSYLKKLKSPLKKRKYEINAMTVSRNIVINHLKTIKALVEELQTKTESIMETVKEGVLDAAVIRKNMEALKETFQKLEVEVNRCNWDVNAVSGAALNCAIKNWI